MAENDDAPRTANHRVGLTRFMVPHAAFDWYVRGIALSALGFGALTGVVSWGYHLQLFDALGLGHQAGWPELVAQYGRLSLLAAGVVSVTSAMFITVVAMFLFHRIVGPVYRMKQHMIAVANGEEVRALRFRDTDQLADVCDVYNRMLVALDVIDEEKPEDAPATGADQTA
jgi:methyl-accepting chemotaxis protein